MFKHTIKVKLIILRAAIMGRILRMLCGEYIVIAVIQGYNLRRDAENVYLGATGMASV